MKELEKDLQIATTTPNGPWIVDLARKGSTSGLSLSLSLLAHVEWLTMLSTE